ncbi:MAG: hypothetical protein OXC91_12810 [Rhodobacteraceae bacterium]|nr:hypothetical protein [Paracoccaceae bacterium]MDD9799017.1 hypothetical protein [Gammaproteobacteria bacterium]MDD9851551.1 hypothetical protein [Gammaproteobacteria bacterium]
MTDLKIKDLQQAIEDCVVADRGVLDALRDEIRPLKSMTRRIQPRTATSISLVGADGGNNQLRFDPFLVQLIRVVDSSDNEYCLEAVSPTTPIRKIDARQFNPDETPRTALGEMMISLGVDSLRKLSYKIRPTDTGKPVSSGWVSAYRELVEWAVLFSLLKKDFGTDTLIVCDGLLRSWTFAGELFYRLRQKMNERIEMQWHTNRRRIYLAGVAKHSKVISRYRLAMALEGILQVDYPAFVEVPREIEERAYVWSEFARGNENVAEGGETGKYVGGKMFLVKFGSHRRDPVWPVDIFIPQADDPQVVLGAILSDTINGFPVPHYPRCLQKAHENAALTAFDFDILQDFIYKGVRSSLGKDAGALDTFQLQDADPSQRRYG